MALECERTKIILKLRRKRLGRGKLNRLSLSIPSSSRSNKFLTLNQVRTHLKLITLLKTGLPFKKILLLRKVMLKRMLRLSMLKPLLMLIRMLMMFNKAMGKVVSSAKRRPNVALFI